MWDGVSESLLSRPAFDVAERTFSWRDVLLAARTWGVWGECERSAREGLARLAAGDGAAGEEELRARERAFRREHGLLSAEELEAWLTRWQLEAPDWRGYLRAEALRERSGAAGAGRSEGDGRAPGAAGDDAPGAPEPGELDRAAWARAVCSGALEGVLERLGAVAAVASAQGSLAEGELDEAGLERMDEAYASFRDAAIDARALEREIELRTLDWTRFELRYLESGEEEVVREAALCVREDGMDLEQVAAEAGLEVQRQSTDLAALHEDVRSHVLGERAGGILGPLALDGAWRLVEVLERRAPALEDPALRERAASALMRSAVEAEVVDRVRWHERV